MKRNGLVLGEAIGSNKTRLSILKQLVNENIGIETISKILQTDIDEVKKMLKAI